MDLVGRKFSSYWEVDAFLKKYELENKIQLICQKSTKLNSKTILKNVSKKGRLASKLNRALEYYNLIYRCVHGIRKRQSEVSHEKLCPFFIQFRLTSDCQKLFITSAVIEHKHVDTKINTENNLKRKRPLDLIEGRNDVKETIVPTKKPKKKIRKKSESQIPPLVWFSVNSTKQNEPKVTKSAEISDLAISRKRKTLEGVSNKPGSDKYFSQPSKEPLEPSQLKKENTITTKSSTLFSEKVTNQLKNSELPHAVPIVSIFPNSSSSSFMKANTQSIPPLSLLKTHITSTSTSNIISSIDSVVLSDATISTLSIDNKRGLPEKLVSNDISRQAFEKGSNKVPPLAILNSSASWKEKYSTALSRFPAVLPKKKEHKQAVSALTSHKTSTATKLQDVSQSSSIRLVEGHGKLNSATSLSVDKSPSKASESPTITNLCSQTVKEGVVPPVPPLALLTSISPPGKCVNPLTVKCSNKPISVKLSSSTQEEQPKLATHCLSSSSHSVDNLGLSPISSTIKAGLTKSNQHLVIPKKSSSIPLKNNCKNETDHCYAKVASSNLEQLLPVPPLASFSGAPVLPSQMNPLGSPVSISILSSPTKDKELTPDLPPLTLLKKNVQFSMNKNYVSRADGLSTLSLSSVTELQTPDTNILDKNKMLNSSDLTKSIFPKIILEPPPLKSFSSSTAFNRKNEMLNPPFISTLQKDSTQLTLSLTPNSVCPAENKHNVIKTSVLKPSSPIISAPKNQINAVPPLTLISNATAQSQKIIGHPPFPFSNDTTSDSLENQEIGMPLLVPKSECIMDFDQRNELESRPSSLPPLDEKINQLSKNETFSQGDKKCHSPNDCSSGSSFVFIKSEPRSPSPEPLSSPTAVHTLEECKAENSSPQFQSRYGTAMEICQELCTELIKHSPNEFYKVLKSLEFLRDCVKDKVPFIVSTQPSNS